MNFASRTRTAIALFILLAADAAAPAQVKYPPRPETVDVQIRYRIRAARDERVRQFRVLEKNLKELGFQKTRKPDDDLDIVDPGGGTGGTVIFDADTASGGGAISVGAGTIATNGGAITFGGQEATATNITAGTGFAVGDAASKVGVNINSTTLNAGSGAIVINGDGYTAGTNTASAYGVEIHNSATLETTGSGAITLTGTGGGSGTGHDNYGIYINTGTVEVVNGALSMTAFGGTGTGIQNFGIQENSGIIETTGTGNILLTGTGGGSGAGGTDAGIVIADTIESTATGGGGITLIGYGGDMGGSGGDNYGVWLAYSNPNITSVDGNILIDGNTGTTTGQTVTTSTGSGNSGIYIDGTLNNDGLLTVGSTGNATITINGVGGGSGASGNDSGVVIDDEGVITSVNGNILVAGTGANGSGGGNAGIVNMYAETTGAATITLIGTGGSNASDTNGGDDGIDYSGAQSTATNGGGITLIGYVGDMGGGATTYGNTGVLFGGTTITSKDGNILIDGNTGTTTGQTVTTSTGNSNGVDFSDNYESFISSTGNAAITINGVGGGSGANDGVGVNFQYFAAAITTVNGNIAITGTGYNGIGSWGGTISSSGAGSITITGTGTGNFAGGGYNYGINDFGITIESTGTNGGGITLIGYGGGAGGTGGNNYGVALDDATLTSKDGNILIDGNTGTTTGQTVTTDTVGENWGVYLNDSYSSNSISSTGNATITINGVGGGSGAGGSNGIEMASTTGIITSVSGNIILNGTGSSTGTNGNISGIAEGSGDTISSTGTASITLTGTGGGNASDSTGHDYGIAIDGTVESTLAGSTAGSITLIGTGGDSGGTGRRNYGVYLPGSTITSVGGNISITGTGGASSGSNNFGIDTDDSVGAANIGTAASTAGNISLIADTWSISTAHFAANTTGNYLITTTDTGSGNTIGLAGTSPTGALAISNAILTDMNLSSAASLTVGATGDAGLLTAQAFTPGTNLTLITGAGVVAISGVQAGGSHSFTIETDATPTFGSNTVTTTGLITIETEGNTLGVGTHATGTVNLTDTELGDLTGGSFQFGSTITGSVDIDTAATNLTGGALSFISGATVYLDKTGDTSPQALTKSSGGATSLTLQAGSDIVTNGAITASGSGNAWNITLDSDYANANSGYIDIEANIATNGGNITMGGGSGAITAGSGYAWGNAGETSAVLGGEGTAGVFIDTGVTVNAGTGAIVMNGKGGNTNTSSDGYSQGVNAGVNNEGTIETSGSGAITLYGTGGSNTGVASDTGIVGENYGVVNIGTISAVDGTITLNGTGGSTVINNSGVSLGNAVGDNEGVISNGGSGISILTTGIGAINLTGQGGTDSGSSNFGADGSNYGVDVRGISAVNGAVTINGTGGTSTATASLFIGGDNIGVSADYITFTGTGTLSITGQGGNDNLGANGGVDTGPLITGDGGAMSISGTGGNGSGPGNIGAIIQGVISNTGNGTITVTGTGVGSGNSGSDYGVYVQDGGAGAGISTADGLLTVTGTGGGAGTGTNNYGVYVTGTGASIATTGSGNIGLTGIRGGGATASNYGVYLDTIANAVQTTGSGNVVIAADTISLNHADNIDSAGNVTIAPYTQNGTIGIDGATGTLGLTSAYLADIDSTTLIIGRSDSTGLVRLAGADLSADTFGNLSLLNGSANIQFDGGTSTLPVDASLTASSASGNIVIAAASTLSTSGTGAITLAAPVTLAGDLTLTSAGTVTLGGAVNGDFNLDASADAISLASGLGGTTPLAALSLTSTNALTLPSIAADSIFAQTTAPASNLTIGSGSILAASGSNTAITLAAGGNFINDEGSSALSTPGGRWLVYSTDPADNQLGNLPAVFDRYTCTYGGTCPAFPASGNGLLYSDTPDLLVTPTGGIDLTAGDPTPNLTDYSYTTSAQLPGELSTDSITGSLSGTTDYTSASPAGSYTINYSSGALTSALGYGFIYANNSSGITVDATQAAATAIDLSQINRSLINQEAMGADRTGKPDICWNGVLDKRHINQCKKVDSDDDISEGSSRTPARSAIISDGM